MANEMNIDKLNIEIEVNSKDGIAQLTKLSNTLKNLKGSANGISNTSNGLKNITKNVTGAMRGFSKLSGSLTKIAVKGTALIGTYKAVSSVLSNLLAESSEYTEVLNKLEVSLGGASASAVDFADKVNELLGIDLSEWLDYQSTFASMLKGFKVQEKDIQLMSQNLTQLAYDYSSLYNKSVQESFNKLNSGLSGQIKGLKEYGSNVSVAAVNEMLRKKGIDATMKSLDASGQAYARYITIMENAKVTGVFNDMARTIDTTANRVRILQSQFTQLKRALGDIINIVAGSFLPVLNTLLSALIKGVKYIGELLGFDPGEALNNNLTSVSDKTNDISNNLGDTSKKLSDTTKKAKEFKKQLQGFDEINIIPAPDKSTSKNNGNSNGSIFGNDINWGELPQYNFLEGLEESINRGVDKWFKELKIAVSGGAYNIGLFLGQSLSDAFSNIDWTKIQKSASIAGTKFAKFLNGFLDGVNWSNMGNNVAQSFNTVLSFLSSAVDKFNFKKLGTSIANYLSNAIGNINWSKLGKTASNLFKGSLDALISFIDEFDWFKVGKGIGDALANIDYIGIATKLFKLLTRALGGALKGLSGFISGTVKNPVTLGLTAIASLKTINTLKPKVTTLLTKISGFFKPVGTMIDKVLTSTSWGDGLINVWCRVGDELNKSGLSTKIGDLSKAILNVDKASGSTKGALGKLGTAIGNMSLGGVAGTLGGIAAGVALVWKAYDENQPDWQKASKEMQQIVTDAENVATSMEEAVTKINDSLSTKLAEADILEDTINNLKNLGTGVLKGGQLETAKMYVERINKQMPDTVKITKDGRIEWKKTDKEIKNNIESLKKKAVVDAKQKIYAEYIDKQYKAMVNVKKAQKEYNKQVEKYTKMWKEGNYQSSLEEFLEVQGDIKNAKDGLDKTKKSLEKVNDELDDTEDILNDVENEILGTSKTADKNPIDVKTTVDPVTGKVKKVKSDGQKEANKSNINYGTEADSLESKAKARREEAQRVVDGTKIKFDTEIIEQPSSVLKDIGKKISDNVQKGTGKVTVESKGESKEKSKKTGKTLKTNVKAGIGTAVEIATKISTDIKKMGKNFGKDFKEGLKSIEIGFGLVEKAGKDVASRFKFYANGGLPSKGQMFIANEKGPELIGNIGGQSFVANQNQVMSMMSNALGIGISQAMQSMMSTSSVDSDRPIQITINQVLDGDVIGQSYVKYHNGIVSQTGKSPIKT